MAICNRCGVEFDPNKAAEEFEEQNPYVDYFDDIRPSGSLCASCALQLVADADAEDDGMEPCCVACGNGAYPDCKASCSIFDD